MNYNILSNVNVCCFRDFFWQEPKGQGDNAIACGEMEQISGNVPVWWLTISKYQTIIGCECDFTFICYNGNLELSKTQLLDSLSHCLKDVTIEIKTKIE